MSRLFFISTIVVFLCLGGNVPLPSAEKQNEDTLPDESAFRIQYRQEAGVPMFNKIPFLNRYFISTSVTDGPFLWEEGYERRTAVVSPDGKWLLTGVNQDILYMNQRDHGWISLWSLVDPKDYKRALVPVRDLRNSYIDWMTVTQDSSQFFAFFRPSGNYEPGVIKQYDLKSGEEIREVASQVFGVMGCVSPDGRQLCVATLASLEFWDVSSGEKIRSLPFTETEKVFELRFSPDGRFVYAGTKTKKILVFDLQEGKQENSIDVESDQFCFDVTSDGKNLLIVENTLLSEPNRYQPRIKLYDLVAAEILRESDLPLSENDSCTIEVVSFSEKDHALHYAGSMKTERKSEIEFKTILGKFVLEDENQNWQNVPYESLPLNAVGKNLLRNSVSRKIHLSFYHERAVAVDAELPKKKVY